MERSRARLFCRHSDPDALLEGLRAVESCAARLWSVARSLEELTEEDEGLDEAGRTTLGEVVGHLGEARSEIAECAGAIEAAAVGAVGAARGGEARWARGEQDHHPELLMVGLPESGDATASEASGALGSAAGRCRLQVAAVKDRYTVVLPGLPWVGPERDDFAGARLTRVRAELEHAERMLRMLALGAPSIDLTVGDAVP
ncbi:MAG: hypothetical protein R2716_02140 [Microthrixaceae bacterium]